MRWQRIREDERFGAVLAGVLTVVVLGIYSGFHPTYMNNYVWEADGWLRGYTYLPHFPGDYIDAIPYHGRAYVYEAPFPAVLLLPFVAVWGLSTNQTLLAIGLAAIAIGAAWLVARRIGVSAGWTAHGGFNVQASVARRIGHNPDPTSTGTDQDGSLDKNRVWVLASVPF